MILMNTFRFTAINAPIYRPNAWLSKYSIVPQNGVLLENIAIALLFIHWQLSFHILKSSYEYSLIVGGDALNLQSQLLLYLKLKNAVNHFQRFSTFLVFLLGVRKVGTLFS